MLKDLDLSKSKLERLSEGISQLQSLERLDLSRNPLSPQVFNVLTSLQSLRYLDLSKCRLKNLPQNLSLLTGLVQLRLQDNNFTSSEAIDVFTSFRCLRLLYLTECELDRVPPSLSHLCQLEELDLSNNWIRYPESLRFISPLQTLTSLKLRCCAVTVLPENFQNLTELRELDLARNNLTDITPIWKMKKLENLILWANEELQSVYPGILELVNLKFSELRGCLFTPPPREVFQSGAAAIRNYYSQRDTCDGKAAGQPSSVQAEEAVENLRQATAAVDEQQTPADTRLTSDSTVSEQAPANTCLTPDSAVLEQASADICLPSDLAVLEQAPADCHQNKDGVSAFPSPPRRSARLQAASSTSPRLKHSVKRAHESSSVAAGGTSGTRRGRSKS